MSAKEVRASDVRPLPVLEETLNYLLSLPDSTEHPFEVIHDFVFDRTRSVRQDLIMQNIVNDKAINMFEKIVRKLVNLLFILSLTNIIFSTYLRISYEQSSFQIEMGWLQLHFSSPSANSLKWCWNHNKPVGFTSQKGVELAVLGLMSIFHSLVWQGYII